MKKKNIVLYVTILLVGIIISGFFLPFHTVPDTYNVLQQKQEYCTTFIKDGRIFSALFLFLGIKLNIPITLLCIVSNIIALIVLAETDVIPVNNKGIVQDRIIITFDIR